MRVLAVLLSIMFLASSAWAEEPASPPANPPPAKPPAQAAAPKMPFGTADLMPAKDVVLKDWTRTDAGAPAEAPTVESLKAAATAGGVPEGAALAEVVVLRKGEGEAAKYAVAAWVALEVESDERITKAHQQMEDKGWLLKSVAHPRRVLVTWAADMEDARAVQAWQVEHAIRGLCGKGWGMVEALSQEFDQTARQQTAMIAQSLIGAALETEPDAGLANAMAGAFLAQANPAQALVHNRKALAKDAPVPPDDVWIVQAAHAAGQVLLVEEDKLEQGNKAMLEEALGMLTRAVELEASVPNPIIRFGNRYNLSCTHARLGDLDKAFEQLEASLRFLKKAWEEDKAKSFSGISQLDYPTNYEWAKVKDTDMASLRKDARWEPLMTKLDPEAQPDAAVKRAEDDPKKDTDK